MAGRSAPNAYPAERDCARRASRCSGVPHSRRCVLRLRVVEYLERAAWDIERQAPLVSSGRIFRPLGPFPPRRALSSKIYVAERGRSIEAVCTGWGHSPPYTREAPNGGLGRKATKHARTLFDRFWLQAADRHIANSVGFTFSSGHSAADLADAPLPPP